MSKQAVQRDVATIADAVHSRTGDQVAYRQVFDALNKSVPFAEGFVVSSVPRGGMQIVAPSKVPDVLVHAYALEAHKNDRVSWQAIHKKKPLRGTEAWGNAYEQSAYLRDFMLYNCNFYHVVAVPLKGPVFAGYPGAIQLLRYREQGPFTDAEIAKIVEVAKLIDGAVEQIRQTRTPQQFMYQAPWAHRLPQRQFIFDAKGRCVYGNEGFSALDDKLRHQIADQCRSRVSGKKKTQIAERVQMPDSQGDLWTFRIIPYEGYSAFGDGTYVFVCLQVEAGDWATVRPTDFQADSEMVRLLPAVRFMQQEFHRSPALGAIARVVHLSSFHFHRRFTELLGLTPKHFLLECQIYETKRQLMAQQKNLAQIASDCGFAHQSHFTSRFKQVTGLTPTRWRRMAQDLQRVSV